MHNPIGTTEKHKENSIKHTFYLMLTQEAHEFGVGEGAPRFPRENLTLGGLSDDETSWELRKSKLQWNALLFLRLFEIFKHNVVVFFCLICRDWGDHLLAWSLGVCPVCYGYRRKNIALNQAEQQHSPDHDQKLQPSFHWQQQPSKVSTFWRTVL